MRSKLAVLLLTRGALIVTFGLVSALGTGCVVHEQVVEEPTNEDAVVEKEPPAEQAETPPAAPSGDYVWVKGHWKWNASAQAWGWQPGHWERNQSGKEWVGGHWERRPKGYVWIAGHWR